MVGPCSVETAEGTRTGRQDVLTIECDAAAAFFALTRPILRPPWCRRSTSSQLAVCLGLLIGATQLSAQRAASPADATVFVRAIGSARLEIEEAGSRRVVDLEQVEIGTGSGFIVSPNGYVLTNQHVVEGGTDVQSRRQPPRLSSPRRVSGIEVCFSPETASAQGATHSMRGCIRLCGGCPTAIWRCSSSARRTCRMSRSEILTPYRAVRRCRRSVFRWVRPARGRPHRRAAQSTVPEHQREQTAPSRQCGKGTPASADYLQVTSSINPGNSGGPLVDDAGFAVGVIRMRIRGADGIAFAIPINDIQGLPGIAGPRSTDADSAATPGPVRDRAREEPRTPAACRLAGCRADEIADGNGAGSADVTLRVDRLFTPWTTRQVEQSLVTFAATRALFRGPTTAARR